MPLKDPPGGPYYMTRTIPPPAAFLGLEKNSGAARDDATYSLLVNCASGVYVVPLEKRSYVLGRVTDCDVVVADGSVSRRHAKLTLGAAPTLEDLGSSNGTSLQGRTLTAGVVATITPGTAFELGQATFVLQRARPATTTATAPRSVGRIPASSDPCSTSTEPVVVDPSMRSLYALLDVVAPSPLTVLILGETGVGKEVYAQAIHARSLRASKPFLQVNCAALPESLLNGELFGYEKGAFTGAVKAKAGLFEAASGGTVFLDEVGEISMTTQAKLLHVLESGQVMRLGSVKPKIVDVRFVAATNRNMRHLVARGRFRQDLYFRLNGMSITLPPLRSRRADIVPIATALLQRAADRAGRSADLTPAALEALEGYGWPGNVRELRNVIERAMVLCRDGHVDVEHLSLDYPEFSEFTQKTSSIVDETQLFGLPPDESNGSHESAFSPYEPPEPPSSAPQLPRSASRDPNDLRVELKSLEKERVLEALTKCAGNQSQAARMLGISRYALIHRIEQFGLARPRKAPAILPKGSD